MKRQDFNQSWKYHKEGSDKVIPVTLPHDAMIHDTRDPESPGTHANAYGPSPYYLLREDEKICGMAEDHGG